MSRDGEFKSLPSKTRTSDTGSFERASPGDRKVLKHDELPEATVSLFTLLRYGTKSDLALQAVGTIMSVGSGERDLDLFR